MEQEDQLSQITAVFREPVFVVLAFAIGAYAIVWLRIFRRTGLSPVLGALMVIPPLMLLLPFYMAFARWPVERPVLRTKARKAPVQALVRHASVVHPHPDRPALTVPGFDPDEPPSKVYAGRDYVPLHLREENRSS